MKQFKINLKQFREARGLLTYNHEAFIKMVNEELHEVLTAKNWNHRIEEMCDVCVLCFNALAQTNIEYVPKKTNRSDYRAVNNAVSYATKSISLGILNLGIDVMRDCITLNGYDFDKAMLETSKKILSRKGAMNPETGKWEKDVNQDKATLYTPDYSKCIANKIDKTVVILGV